MREFKSSVEGDTSQYEVIIENQDEFTVLEGGVEVPFEGLSASDQQKITELLKSDKVKEHFFMEDASDSWDGLNREYLFGLVQDLNSMRKH